MFIDRIEENCYNLKGEMAYICENERLTYGELWSRASSLAAYLKSGGSSPVVVYGHKSPYMLVCFFACLLSGRAYVPCDTSSPEFRMEYIINTSGSGLTLLTEDLNIEGTSVINPSELVRLCGCGGACDPAINADDTAYIIFTSGSTGRPKGVPISVKNLDNFVGWATRLPAVAELSRGVVLNQAAFSFDLCIADIFISLVMGHTLFAVTRREQENLPLLFERLKKSDCSLIVCTPTFMRLCLCDSAFDSSLLPRLKTVFFCGEVLHVKTARRLFERFPDLKILNAYGPTEATCAVTAAEITKDMLSLPSLPIGSISQSAVDISVTSEETESIGSEYSGYGEITLKGDSVSRGYINLESGSFKIGGQYMTGDTGRIENGLLYYVGRNDTQIKYKGYRIEPMEIERCITEVDGVSGAAVVPVEAGGKVVIALIAYVEAGREVTPEHVKAKLLKMLPPYMIPKSIKILDKIPVNANGKCDRMALTERPIDGS